MSRPAGWVISACALGLAAYIAGLILTLPAVFIDTGLDRASRSIVRLTETRGTAWSGTGQLEIREKGRRIGNTHRLTWHFLPWSVLRGHLAFEIKLDQASQPVLLKIHLWRIELSNAEIILPAAVLALMEPRLVPLKLGGDLSLHAPHLSIGRQQIQGNWTLKLHKVTSELTAVAPLGDYQLDVTSSGNRNQTVMRTLQGPLHIDGAGSWTSGGATAFAGTARIPVSLQQQLAPLLRLIAVERSEGNFEIQLK